MGATFSIDPVTLREVPDDARAAWRHVRELEALGEAGDGDRVAWLRILGDLDAAEDLGRRVLERAGGPAAGDADPTLPWRAVAPALRLAQVLQWQGRHDPAEHLMRNAVGAAGAAARAHPDDHRALALLAHAEQHLGKVLLDQGRDRRAWSCLRRALAIRTDTGAPADEVLSSRVAVASAAARLERRSRPGYPP